MCGRFVSTAPLSALAEEFRVDEVRTDELPPSYNVAPFAMKYLASGWWTTMAEVDCSGWSW